MCSVGEGSFLSLFFKDEKTSVPRDTTAKHYKKKISKALRIVKIRIMCIPPDAWQIGFVGKEKDCRPICHLR